MHDVEIVDQCPRGRVLTKECVGQTHHLAIALSEKGSRLRRR
jgi:hypothetical protein